MESRQRTSFRAIAETEGISHSYVARIFRLSFLAPDIVEAILKGRQPVVRRHALRRDGFELSSLMADFPDEWERQREVLGFPIGTNSTKPLHEETTRAENPGQAIIGT
ncbi:MAG: hypothetical protein H7840_14910 [Alphaproteobacteria bacterium]